MHEPGRGAGGETPIKMHEPGRGVAGEARWLLNRRLLARHK
jgi:hypothetical protein